MKRIKTDLRNRMNTATLDTLLRIRIEGRDLIQFNFKEAVRRWKKHEESSTLSLNSLYYVNALFYRICCMLIKSKCFLTVLYSC